MIPAALGNIVRGGRFVSAMYWYLYLTGPGNEDIKFVFGGLDTGNGVWHASKTEPAGFAEFGG